MSKKFRVEMAAAVRRDLFEIYDHIAADSPQAARVWVSTLERQVATLGQMPFRCPPIPENREMGALYRHLIHGAYRLVFRIEGETVWVVRIVHGAQLLRSEDIESTS